MEAYKNLSYEKKNIISYFFLSCAGLVFGIILFFFSIEDFEFVCSVIIIAIGVLYMVLGIIKVDKYDRSIQFTVNDKDIQFKNIKYDINEIETVMVVASLGKLIPKKKGYNHIENMVKKPPCENLNGCIRFIVEGNKSITYNDIKDVMKLAVDIRNKGCNMQIYYRYGSKKCIYEYFENTKECN